MSNLPSPSVVEVLDLSMESARKISEELSAPWTSHEVKVGRDIAAIGVPLPEVRASMRELRKLGWIVEFLPEDKHFDARCMVKPPEVPRGRAAK